MTPLFQSGYEFLAWPRDLLMGPVSHIPWVQHQMIATMAGVKQGVRDSIPQEAEVLRMGARFAFGAMVQPEPEPTAVLRW